jgi:AcrR family transcriptional regulator
MTTMVISEPKARRAVKGHKSEQRVESLLAVAREVFSERGYERTTTLEIAQRLSISEATVFSYFGSKRELCIEVVRRWYDEISSELEREIPMRSNVRHALEFAILKHLSQLIEEGAGLCALVLSEGRIADAAFMQLIAQLKRRYIAPLMQAMEAARATGEIRSDIPLHLQRDMIYGAMEHVLWGYVNSGRKPDIQSTAAQLSDLLWTAFAPPQLSLNALMRFRSEVVGAVKILESESEVAHQL